MGLNFIKIVECLKNKFGREGLSIEVYMRVLLGIVLKTSLDHEKVLLSSLYVKLECHLRASVTLDVTADKFG